MQQKIYDSKQQAVVDFKPLTPDIVSMYVCGPTVQSAPHIGHLRSALVYDQMRAWFTACGNRVTLVSNITDIDDKILVNAQKSTQSADPETWWQLAYRVETLFNSAYRMLGIAPFTAQPRATGYIAEMDALIGRLITAGYAYRVPDGSVYFDTAAWPQYGQLTRQSLDAMAQSAQGAPGKRNACDFALWKAAKPDEPQDARWEISNAGAGRPGWHIECSAMAARFLGSAFDIHGGGRDLRFPHHENELAQSQAAGDAFASYWVHNGLVNVGDQKMSKSLGNSLYAADLLEDADPLVVRYLLGSAHYRSTLVYSAEALADAASAIERISAVLERAKAVLHEQLPDPIYEIQGISEQVPAEFAAAMYDDFAIPKALAVLHTTVREINTAIDSGSAAVVKQCEQLVAMLAVLNLDPRSACWRAGSADDKTERALAALVEQLLAARADARAQKNWALSDMIRDQLAAAGVQLADSAAGTTWSI